jgi:hypothetical protein
MNLSSQLFRENVPLTNILSYGFNSDQKSHEKRHDPVPTTLFQDLMHAVCMTPFPSANFIKLLKSSKFQKSFFFNFLVVYALFA